MTHDRRRLHTLHVNTEKTWRGGEQLTLYLLDGLKKRGHSTHVLAQPDSPMAERARQNGHLAFEHAMHGEIDLLAVNYIAGLIRRQKYDIVHLHTPHAHTLGGLAAAFGHSPVRLANKRTDFSIYRHSFFGLNKYKYNCLTDCVIAESKRIREVLLEDGLEEEIIALVYEGIDPHRFEGSSAEPLRKEFGLSPRQPIVGNIAHFADHKGQIYFVKAIPEIIKEFPEAVFFLVGQGELREGLMKLARDLEIDHCTYFPGFRTDIGNFFELFNIFVISSHMEGLCTSIMDSFACSTPVVATKAGGIPELVHHEETGFLVPPKGPSALAKTLIRALNNPDQMKEMAQRGHEMVMNRFTVRHMVEETIDLYYRLLEKKKGRDFVRQGSGSLS